MPKSGTRSACAMQMSPGWRGSIGQRSRSGRAANIREQMKSKLHHLPHDTRHTFASLAVEEEIDQRLIDEILGHAHQNLTLDVYSHLGLQRKLDAVNRIVSNL